MGSARVPVQRAIQIAASVRPLRSGRSGCESVRMPVHPSPLLIATLGSKAQIIMLTLEALVQQGDLPGEVVVIHTYCERPETAEALARLKADLPLTYPLFRTRTAADARCDQPLARTRHARRTGYRLGA